MAASIDDLIDVFYEAALRPEMLPDAVLAAHRRWRSAAQRRRGFLAEIRRRPRAPGRLRTRFPQDQPALDRLLACAADPRLLAWAENAQVLIQRTDGQPPLTARAIAVARRLGPFAPDPPASVILTVEGFEAEGEAVEALLRRRFGLSPAQGRVAASLRSGKTLQEAARELGISYDTVRSHLKALFEKTGTRRQVELVMLLRRGMPF